MSVLPQLTTDRLLLRRAVASDAQAVYDAYGKDPEVTRYLPWPAHQSVDDAEDFLARSLQTPGLRLWLITHRRSGEVLGSLSLSFETSFRVAAGYVVGRAHWSKGYATEALRCACDWAFTHPAIYRVWAMCDVDNLPSARVMEKAGLHREALLHRFLLHPQVSSEPRDALVYAKVR